MKHVTIKLSQDEYKLLRATMRERNVDTVQEAMVLAIRSFVDGHATNNLGALTKLQERRLAGVLRHLRDRPDDTLLPGILTVLTEYVEKKRC